MKETAARVVALKNGEVDIINGLDANVIDEIKKSGNKVFQTEGNNTNYMVYNCRDGYITADRDVREAIAKAVTFQRWQSICCKEYSTPAHSFFPPLLEGYDKNNQAPKYNPEAAKKTLAAKGIWS